jgi:uncharacterized protein
VRFYQVFYQVGLQHVFLAFFGKLTRLQSVTTIYKMRIDFDPRKNDLNISDRGLSFELVRSFDFETAVFQQDTRHDYGETRLRALGYLDGRLHALVFTETATGIRVISFRKANKREVLMYEQKTTS